MDNNVPETTPQPSPTNPSENTRGTFASAVTSSSTNVTFTETSSGPSPAETPQGAEVKSSRDEVIQAVNSSFDSFTAYPEEKLTKEQVAEREYLKKLKEATLDKDRGSRRIRFSGDTGKEYSEQEYVPVDTLINFLRERIKSGELSSEDIEKYKNEERILHQNAKEYYRTGAKKELTRKQARISHEAKRISSDQRLSTGNPHDDDLLAGNILFRRRELILPSRDKKNPPITIPPVPPIPPIPDPIEPDPIEPDPVEPDPIEPDPVEPDPIEPDPDDPETPTPDPEPIPAPPEQVRREIYIINRTVDLRKRAAELAELHLRDEQRKGKLWNPLSWARKTKLRVLEEYYRQKFMKEASEKMLENNNTYLGLDVFKNAAVNATNKIAEERAAGRAKIEEFKTGEQVEGQQVSEVTGAVKGALLSEIILNDAVTADNVQEKLREFITSHQDDDQVKELFGNDATRYGELAKYFATDLLEVRRQLREDAAAHGTGIDRVTEALTIKLANANWAAETQVKWSAADKAIAWSLKNNKNGLFINPAVVGAVTSIGLYGGMRGLGYSGKALLAAAPGAGILVGASFAALRRAHDLKVDRASHQVEMAYGSQLPERDAKRRKSLEKFALEATSVNTLLSGGSERTTVGGDTRGMRELMGLDLTTVENRQALMQRVSEIRTRLDYSSSQKIDLIKYQSRETVEQGRLDLVKSVAEAKKKLLDAGVTQDQLDGELGRLYGDWSRQFLTDRESQDKAFNRYRVKQSLISGGIGGASGLVIGLGAGVVAREMMEHTIGNTHISGLEHVPGLNKLTGKTDNTQEHLQALSSEGKPTQIGDLTLSMDASHHVVTTTPNGISQVHENWTIDGNGHILATGEVPPNIKDEFKIEGFDISEHVDRENFNFDPSLAPDQDQLPGLQHQTFVPHGTGWIQSPDDSEKWNLVVDQRPDLVLIHDAAVTPDGQSITYDSVHSALGENAFTNNRIVELEPARLDSKDVFGPEGLWEKNGTAIDHREWYGNNTKYSDLNELRAYNSVFTSNGQKGIDWDMSHMQPGGSFQDGNHPQSVNVQEVIGQGKAAIAFSTPDHQGNPIIITDDSDAWIDGHFRLDPTDTVHHINSDPNSMTVAEFSKLVVDQQKLSSFPDGSLASELTGHQDLFTIGKDGKPGFIETGRLVDIDGKKVFQPFATAQGTGNAPATLEIPIPPKMDSVIDITPKPVVFDHTVTEIIPPSDHEIPIIPWVVSPRYPLEPLTETGGVYYGYFEPMTEERKQLFESNRSKTLKENPGAKLDPYKETEEYFARQEQEYIDEIKSLSQTISQPMASTVKAVIGIPVAGHEEGTNIYNSLVNYTFQEADKNSYEIMLFVNHPEGTSQDNTMSEIDRFKRDYPDMPVRVMYKQLPREQAKMAVIRKYLNDVALYRHQQLGPTASDLILVSNDADLKGLAPTYIKNFIEKLDGKENDGMVGQLDWDPESYIEYPAIHAGTRLFQYLNLLVWDGKHGDRPSSGANFAFKGSIYAGIGGYQINDMPGAEDVILGQAIRAARGGGKTLGYAGARVSRLYTSSRRAIDAWNTGFAPIEQWDRNWGVINDSIRRHALGEHVTVNYDDPATVEKIKSDISLVAGRTLNYFKDQDGDLENPTFKKAMKWLGVEYKVDSAGNVEITDISAFVRGIKQYQKYGAVLQQVKSGKLPKSALTDLDAVTERVDTPPSPTNPFRRSSPPTVPTVTTTTSSPTVPPVPVTPVVPVPTTAPAATTTSSPTAPVVPATLAAPTPVTTVPLTAPVAPTVTAPVATAGPTTAPTPVPASPAAPVAPVAPVTTTTPLTTPIPPAPTAPTPATPEAVDPVPDTLLGRINTSLATEAGTQSSFDLTQRDLLEYVGSLSLPQGAKINAFNTQLVGDHLEVKGNVTARGGSTSFTADLKTGPDGKILVENQDIKPSMLHRPFVGNIRSRITNLDSELTNALNTQLANGWKVEGFGLNGSDINIKFNKTP